MIEYRSSMTVSLVNGVASDLSVAMAAWVSTGAPGDSTKVEGLIRYLMKHRHGTPFEHNSFTFLVECPMFVAREIMRHRMLSFNETSGRYRKLDPVFWMPRVHRGLVNIGTSARPIMGEADAEQHALVDRVLETSYQNDWLAYEILIDAGIANEVARTVLPAGIYTQFYLTCNARSLMHFLSLRIDHQNNTHDTYPQQEIQEVAQLMEEHFKTMMPLTHKAFDGCGRVAP